MMSEFWAGFGFVLSGLRYVGRHKSLRKWIIIPFLIDLSLLWLLLWAGIGFVGNWATTAVAYFITPESGVWYSLAYYPFLLAFLILFSILIFYLVFVMGSIIAAPFNTVLAEQVLIQTGVKQERPFSLGSWVKTSLHMLKISLIKGGVFAALGLLLFVATFIPGVNLVAAFMAFLIVAFDCMDYGFEGLELNFSQRMDHFRARPLQFSGMALFLLLTGLIPGLTLLVIPWAVVGASLLLAQSRGAN